MKNKSPSHLVLTGLFVVLVLAASNSIVRAQDCPGTTHWVGATGDWFDGTNWYLGCVPTYSSDASINNHGGATIDGSNDAMAKSLILGDNQGDSGGVTVAQSAVLDVGTGVFSCRSDIYIGYRGSGALSLKSGGIVKSRYGMSPQCRI